MLEYDPNYVGQKTFFLIGQKAIILNKTGKLLLLKRSSKLDQNGKWSLPGGALEKETPSEGIQREIQEETQLTVSDLRLFFTFSFLNKENEMVVMIGYHCHPLTENVQLNWDHDEYMWVPLDEAIQYDLTDHTKLFIEHFKRSN